MTIQAKSITEMAYTGSVSYRHIRCFLEVARLSSVGQAATALAISQPAVSQHLATLRDAGLVDGRREGRCVYYRVQPEGLAPLVDWIAHFRAFWTDRLGRLEQLLDTLDDAP